MTKRQEFTHQELYDLVSVWQKICGTIFPPPLLGTGRKSILEASHEASGKSAEQWAAAASGATFLVPIQEPLSHTPEDDNSGR